MPLRVALVGGPMYDHLYRLLDGAGVDAEVVVHADHPTLNRAVADLLGRGERLDLISTHSKYAPSQQQWLQPLDGLVDAGGLAPLAVDLCRFEGRLLCLPRLIDVRILWYRRDRLDAPPDTWGDVVEAGVAFGFPGRESGLFGTFFELVVGAGGRLFDDAGAPRIDSPEAVAAAELLAAMAARCPADLPGWHYDQVDRALLVERRQHLARARTVEPCVKKCHRGARGEIGEPENRREHAKRRGDRDDAAAGAERLPDGCEVLHGISPVVGVLPCVALMLRRSRLTIG